MLVSALKQPYLCVVSVHNHGGMLVAVSLTFLWKTRHEATVSRLTAYGRIIGASTRKMMLL
jgi:hypothetical protein